MDTKTAVLTVEEFFARYGPEVLAIAMKARELVLSVMPDATEIVSLGYDMVIYSTSMKTTDMVFYVSAHKAYAKVGLYGVDLPDPAGIMEGTGKHLRHVKLKKLEDVDKPALRVLLESAFVKRQDKV